MPQLYHGERLATIASFPTLYRYLPAKKQQQEDDEKPLVIFIPGMALLGRVAYGGHSGYDERDFLVYWLNELGYNVLAISYPLEMQGGQSDDDDDDDNGLRGKMAQCPHLTPRDWGEQTVLTALKVMEQQGLADNTRVTIAAWSMAGKILKPVVTSSQRHGLNVTLFLSLAATPAGIKGLNFSPPRVRETRGGFTAGSETGIQSFIRQIQSQCVRQEGRNVVDERTLRREYLGNTPVSLTNAGVVYRDGSTTTSGTRFRPVTATDLETTEPNGYDDMVHYPYIAAIRPTSPADLRHALTDSAAWGLILTTKLTVDVTRAIGGNARRWPAGDEDEVWHAVQKLVLSAPTRLTSEVVHGNHMFFLGERGARATAQSMDRLIREAGTLGREMEAVLGRLQSSAV